MCTSEDKMMKNSTQWTSSFVYFAWLHDSLFQLINFQSINFWENKNTQIYHFSRNGRPSWGCVG